MAKTPILLHSLFLIGAAVGAAIMYDRGEDDSLALPEQLSSEPSKVAAESAHPMGH